jgi:hypothetical protein
MLSLQNAFQSKMPTAQFLTLMHIDLFDRGKAVNSNKARYRLLYVSNDLEFYGALKMILTMPNYDLIYTPHVGTAILLLKGDPRYDLLIYDLELDGKEGVVELARVTRSLVHRAHLPVVVTANETVKNLGILGCHSAVDVCLSKRNISVCAEAISTLLKVGERTTDEPVLMPDTIPFLGTTSESLPRHARSYTMTISFSRFKTTAALPTAQPLPVFTSLPW